MRRLLTFLLTLPIVASAHLPAYAQTNPDWLAPMPGFKIADNLYYVGSRDLASYLITTPNGDILINSSYEKSVPLIEESIQHLGFKMNDVKILLISHAHSDHDAGSHAILERTHAKYEVMDADVPVVESGGAKDFAYPTGHYPAAHVDRVLHDGDEVKLGGVTLVAHKTPGHTKGCTTWTMHTTDHGRPVDVVIVGSWNVNSGFKLVNNKGYPRIAADYAHTFDVLNGLPCDIFLGAHGVYFGMLEKVKRLRQGGPNPFVDSEGYRRAVAEKKAAFQKELARQQAGGDPGKL